MPPTRSGPVPGASPPTRGRGWPPAQRRQGWSPRSERRKTKPREAAQRENAAQESLTRGTSESAFTRFLSPRSWDGPVLAIGKRVRNASLSKGSQSVSHPPSTHSVVVVGGIDRVKAYGAHARIRTGGLSLTRKCWWTISRRCSAEIDCRGYRQQSLRSSAS